MPERQPGRPTEEEFIGAAVRFLKGEYTTQVVHLVTGYFAHVHQVYLDKIEDEKIIRREQFAEGLPGERESIRDFALKQLTLYQKSRKH